MSELAASLRHATAAGAAALSRLSPAAARTPPRPGAWCPAEVVGHLVDSAAVNRGRIVRALGRDDLRADGYDQDAWVAAQRYADAPWDELVELWRLQNRHLARVIASIPEAELDRPRAVHTLDRTAWRRVPADAPTTLRYLVADYVGHLRHHLAPWMRDAA